MRARERELVCATGHGRERGEDLHNAPGRPHRPRRDRRSKERRPCGARKVGLDRRLSPAFKSQAGSPPTKSRGHDRGVVFVRPLGGGVMRARERELVWRALASPRAGPSQQRNDARDPFGLLRLGGGTSSPPRRRSGAHDCAARTASRSRPGHPALPDLRGPRGRAGPKGCRPHSSRKRALRQNAAGGPRGQSSMRPLGAGFMQRVSAKARPAGHGREREDLRSAPDARIARTPDRRSKERRPCGALRSSWTEGLSPAFKSQAGSPPTRAAGTTGSSSRATARGGVMRRVSAARQAGASPSPRRDRRSKERRARAEPAGSARTPA